MGEGVHYYLPQVAKLDCVAMGVATLRSMWAYLAVAVKRQVYRAVAEGLDCHLSRYTVGQQIGQPDLHQISRAEVARLAPYR